MNRKDFINMSERETEIWDEAIQAAAQIVSEKCGKEEHEQHRLRMIMRSTTDPSFSDRIHSALAGETALVLRQTINEILGLLKEK